MTAAADWSGYPPDLLAGQPLHVLTQAALILDAKATPTPGERQALAYLCGELADRMGEPPIDVVLAAPTYLLAILTPRETR